MLYLKDSLFFIFAINTEDQWSIVGKHMNIRIGIGILVLLIFAWFLWPQQQTDKEQLQESLHNIVRGIGDRRSKDVLTEISDTYKDQTGWSKQNIRGILFQQFQQKESFSLRITAKEFSITPHTAEIVADVVVFGGSMWNPNSDTMNLLVYFAYKKEKDDVWRVVGHTRIEKDDVE
jgi:hypothetical protein